MLEEICLALLIICNIELLLLALVSIMVKSARKHMEYAAVTLRSVKQKNSYIDKLVRKETEIDKVITDFESDTDQM